MTVANIAGIPVSSVTALVGAEGSAIRVDYIGFASPIATVSAGLTSGTVSTPTSSTGTTCRALISTGLASFTMGTTVSTGWTSPDTISKGATEAVKVST